jgi:hypothetical protein
MLKGDVARPEAVRAAVDWLKSQESSITLDQT